MRSALLTVTACICSFWGVGCCHHHGSSYDPTTGLVGRRCGLFDTCGVGCQHKSKCGCQKKCKRNCGCQHANGCNSCQHGGQYFGGQYSGQLGGYPLSGEGGLPPHGGYYSGGEMIHDGMMGSHCPECEMQMHDSTGTYYGSQPYPELMMPHEASPPLPAPAAEPSPMPSSETSISIPPASYVVPAPLSGPVIPAAMRPVSAF